MSETATRSYPGLSSHQEVRIVCPRYLVRVRVRVGVGVRVRVRVGVGVGVRVRVRVMARVRVRVRVGEQLLGDGLDRAERDGGRVDDTGCREDADDAYPARGKGSDDTDDPAVAHLPVHCVRLPHRLS